MKVYVLTTIDTSDMDYYTEYETILGIFTNPDLAINAANDHITKEFTKCKNENDKSCFVVPDKPLLFEDVFLKAYMYMNNHDYFTSSLIIKSYTLDILEDN